MKAGVVTFPGSNCDDDLCYSLAQAGFEVQTLWHKDTPSLDGFDLVALPGGFSFGDYLRCGAVASRSPIMDKVKAFAESGGLVIGICNGFQILCESGLLPGALAANTSVKFICRDVPLRVENTQTPWSGDFKDKQVIEIPIAHGEGRYVVDEKTYGELVANQQILLSYCSPEGELNEHSNPNGSSHHIAGVMNRKKNVFGLMPHPERASDLRSGFGQLFWSSLKKHIGSLSK